MIKSLWENCIDCFEVNLDSLSNAYGYQRQEGCCRAEDGKNSYLFPTAAILVHVTLGPLI